MWNWPPGGLQKDSGVSAARCQKDSQGLGMDSRPAQHQMAGKQAVRSTGLHMRDGLAPLSREGTLAERA